MKAILQVALKYGAIAGFLGAALLLGLYYMDRHPFLIYILLDFRIFLFGIFIFFALKELRDFHRDGLLSFGEGMITSFIFVTTYALISSTLIYIFATVEDNFVTSFVKLFTEQVKALSEEDVKQIGKDALDRNLARLSSTNAFWMAWNYFKQSYWIGFLISIILSVILRRQPKL
jgi:hypothetical protein